MTESMLAAVREAAAGNGGGASASAALDAARAEGHAAGLAEGRTAGLAAGAAAERSRILGIQAAAFAGQEALAGQLIADGTTTPEAAALRFNADLKAKGPNHVAALSAMDAQVRVPANGSAQGAGAETKTYTADKAGWMAEWADTPALQAEFPTKESYASYKAGVASGAIRVVGGRG